MQRISTLFDGRSHAAIASALLSAIVLFGCGDRAARGPDVVATIHPVAFVVEPVVGTEVGVLLSPGASPHTYDARPSDARAAAGARYLFFASKDLDGWAASLDAQERIGLIDFVPDSLILRESRSGGETHPDPHFWMDPLTVRSLLPGLAEHLCGRQPDQCESYRARAAAFADSLGVVHDSLSAVMQEVRGATVLLSHPFLGYFGRRYGLQIGGILEEIPGSEPTPRDMERMIETARRSDALAIITLPQHPSRAAAAIGEATGLPLVQLDPIGGGADGYADLLYFNARKIRDAVAESARDVEDRPDT